MAAPIPLLDPVTMTTWEVIGPTARLPSPRVIEGRSPSWPTTPGRAPG